MSKLLEELERLPPGAMTEEMKEGIRRAELFRKHELWEAREEGIEERRRQLSERGRDALIRTMLARGADVTQVAALTGLSEDVVRAIAAPTEPPRG